MDENTNITSGETQTTMTLRAEGLVKRYEIGRAHV